MADQYDHERFIAAFRQGRVDDILRKIAKYHASITEDHLLEAIQSVPETHRDSISLLIQNFEKKIKEYNDASYIRTRLPPIDELTTIKTVFNLGSAYLKENQKNASIAGLVECLKKNLSSKQTPPPILSNEQQKTEEKKPKVTATVDIQRHDDRTPQNQPGTAAVDNTQPQKIETFQFIPSHKRLIERHFAHICGEAYVAGAFEIEGFNLTHTSQFLSNFLNDNKGLIPSAGQEICEAFQNLPRYAFDAETGNSEHLVSSILQKTMALKADQFILLPRGWAGTPGHALIYEVKKDDNGDLLFRIYNSGAGLNFHKKKKGEYDPSVVYRIRSKELTKPDFENDYQQFLKKIMTPMSHVSQNPTIKNEEELYQEALSRIEFLGASLSDDNSDSTKTEKYIIGQLAGTCSQSALHEAMKDRFPSQNEFIKFMYRFKAYALDYYVNSLKSSNTYHRPEYRELLEKGIKSNLRLLNRLSKDGNYVFDDDYKKTESKRLITYLQEIGDMPKNNSSVVINTNTTLEMPLVSHEVRIPKIPSLQADINAKEKITPVPPKEIGQTILNEQSKDILTDLKTIISEINLLKNEKRWDEILKRIDHVFFEQLSLPQNNVQEPLGQLYSSLKSNAQVQQFTEGLAELEELRRNAFIEHTSELGLGHELGNKYLGEAKALVLRLHRITLTQHLFASSPIFIENKELGQRLLNHAVTLMPTSQEMSDGFGAATNDPLIDTCYEKIALLRSHQNIDSRNADFVELELFKKEILKNDSLLKIGRFSFTQKKNYSESRDGDIKKFQFLDKKGFAEVYGLLTMMDDNTLRNDVNNWIDKQANREELKQKLADFIQTVECIKSIQASLQTVRNERKFWDYSFVNDRFVTPHVSQYEKITRFAAVELALRFEDTAQSGVHNDLIGWMPGIKCFSRDLNNKLNIDEIRILVTDDKIHQELLLLRSHPESHLTLSIEYFTKHLNYLARWDMQRYFEASIFKPGLLQQQLLTNEDLFFKHFDSLIASGLRVFKNNQDLSPSSVFFVRMNFLVSQYAVRLNPQKYLKRLEEQYLELTKFCSRCQDESIRRSLLKYRFMMADEIMARAPEKTHLYLEDNIEAYFQFSKLHDQEPRLDFDSRYQFRKSQEHFKTYLKTMFNQPNPLFISSLKKALDRMGFNMASAQFLSADYPDFIFDIGGDVITINVDSARIYLNNKMNVVMPNELKDNPMIKTLGFSDVTHCFCKDLSGLDEQYLLQHNGVELQIDGNRYFIKGLPGLARDVWYEVFANSEAQKNQFNLTKVNDFLPLSLTIAEPDVFTLVPCGKRNDPAVALIKQDQLIFKGERSARRAIVLKDHKTNHTLCKNELNQLTETLIHFEPLKYIDVYYDDTNNRHLIKLARYGLSFFKDADQSTLYCMFNGERYYLDPHRKPIDQGIPDLMLVNAKNERVILLPERQFVNINTRHAHSHYEQYQLDVEDKIDEAIIQRTSSKAISWDRAHSKNARFIKLKDNEPIPENSEDALYLAYLYLGAHKPEKAWAMLEFCDVQFGGISGREKEILYLQWMIERLPFDLNSFAQPKSLMKPVNPKKIESTPAVIACQLKALAFLTKINKEKLQIKRKLVNSDKAGNHVTLASEEIAKHQLKETHVFINTLDSRIVELYSRMQSFEKEGEDLERLSLTQEERWLLLDYCAQEINELHENTKLEYRTHYMAMLRRELDALSGRDDPKTQMQKAIIEKNIAELTSVEFYDRSISTETIVFKNSRETNKQPTKDIYFVEPYELKNYEKIKQYCTDKALFDPTSVNETTAMQELHADITEAEIFKNFAQYIAIAENKTNPHFNRVAEFSERTLLALSQSAKLKKSSLFFLAHVLYRVCHNESKDFMLQTKQKFESLVQQERNNFKRIYHSFSEVRIESHCKEKTVEYCIQALIEQAQQYEAPPITTKRITGELNVAPVEILPDDKLIKQPVPIQQRPTPLSSTFKEWLLGSHHQLIQKLQNINTLNGEGDIGQRGSFFSSPEYQTGQQKYHQLMQLKKIAQQLFDPTTCSQLKSQIQEYHLEAAANLNDLEHNILVLAKSKLSVSQTIDIASDKKAAIDLNTLLVLYFQNDMAQYKKITNLSEEEIIALHQQLIDYVTIKTSAQQANRCLKLLDSLTEKATTKEESSVQERSALQLQLAQTLRTENRLDPSQDTVLSTFQINANMILRDDQISTLNKLLSQPDERKNSESIEKIIMGGGKSKVILPTLVQKKANGHNLMIIEVPRSLLQTNFVDLRFTSKSLFNQDAFIFEFDRDSDASPEALKRLYNKLIRAIQNKRYMVTTGEALQSIELKYFDLLNDSNVEASKQSIAYLNQILSLFKERGDLIIDEVHEGLSLKNKLNYTHGSPGKLSKYIAQFSTQFFEFLYNQTYQINSNETLSFSELLSGAHNISASKYEEICRQITKSLMKTGSPIESIIGESIQANEGLTDIQQELENYLLNKAEKMPEFIAQADTRDKEKLAFLKVQLSQILPSTLNRKHMVHYGQSLDPTTPPAERAIAIPYRSNKVPKYGSSFGNEVESVNYTIQSMLLSGIEFELFVSLLKTWKENARNESHILNINEDETKSGKWFHSICGENLSEIDISSQSVQKRLHQKLKFSPNVIFFGLEHNVLPQIKIDQCILHSDAYAHVDIVRSCQGITGTPWNCSTFHQRLSYDDRISRGSDGYVISAIEAKKPTFVGIDFDTTAHFINQILDNRPSNTRAIIDISATFKGIDNLEVACELAKYIGMKQQHAQKAQPQIKYVLFFNEQDQLSALPISPDASNKNVIVIGRSDPEAIQQKLGATTDELFTYYDQTHTVGADIKQSDTAHAITLIDQTTPLQSFLQGTMRMRGLIEREQTIDVVLPREMHAAMLKSEKSPLAYVVDSMYDNEQEKLKIDNFYATIAKINNLIRNDFKIRIIAVDADNVKQQSDYFRNFKSSFIHTNQLDLYSRYGDIAITKKTADILNELKEKALASWNDAILKTDIILTDDEYQGMKKQIQSIVDNRGDCIETSLSSAQESDSEVESMKEQQQEQQMETELQQVKRTVNNTDMRIRGIDYQSWNKQTPVETRSLNVLCQTNIFDEHLTASINFYRSERTARIDMIIGPYMQPVHALYFTQKGGTLSCQMISLQELDEIKKIRTFQENEGSWITTTTHLPLAGKPPDGIENNDQYHRLITQARFFNGDLKLIYQRGINDEWLKENVEEKIDFFEKKVFEHRETSPEELDLIKKNYLFYNKVFNLVLENPNISKEQLMQKFSYCTDEDVLLTTELAKKIKEIDSTTRQPTWWQSKETKEPFYFDKKQFSWCSFELEKNLNALKLLKTCFNSFTQNKSKLNSQELYESLSAQLLDIDISLLKKLYQSNKSNPEIAGFLAYAMAINPHLDGKELQLIINLSESDSRLRYILLKNSSNNINLNEQDLIRIIEYELNNSPVQASEHHLALLKLSEICKTEEKFRGFFKYKPIKGQILLNLFQNKNCTNAFINDVLESGAAIVTGVHIIAALKNEAITDLDLKKTLLKRLLAKLKAQKFGDKDKILTDEVTKLTQEVNAISPENKSSEQTTTLINNVIKVYEHANDPSMRILLKTIKQEQKKFWGISKQATNIEQTICSLDIIKRKNALASNELASSQETTLAQNFQELKNRYSILQKPSHNIKSLAEEIVEEYRQDVANTLLARSSLASQNIVTWLEDYSKNNAIDSKYKLSDSDIKPGKRLRKILDKYDLLTEDGLFNLERFVELDTHQQISRPSN